GERCIGAARHHSGARHTRDRNQYGRRPPEGELAPQTAAIDDLVCFERHGDCSGLLLEAVSAEGQVVNYPAPSVRRRASLRQRARKLPGPVRHFEPFIRCHGLSPPNVIPGAIASCSLEACEKVLDAPDNPRIKSGEGNDGGKDDAWRHSFFSVARL